MDRPNDTAANPTTVKRVVRSHGITPPPNELPEEARQVKLVRPRRIVRTPSIKTATAVEKQGVAKEVLSKVATKQQVIAKKATRKEKSNSKPLSPEGKAIAKVLLGMVDPVDEIEVQSILESQKSILVKHRRKHALWIRFNWVRDHFNGHVVSYEGQEDGEAIVSLWTAAEAREFRKAFRVLVGLRARRMNRGN